jgi:hypothetical protein
VRFRSRARGAGVQREIALQRYGAKINPVRAIASHSAALLKGSKPQRLVVRLAIVDLELADAPRLVELSCRKFEYLWRLRRLWTEGLGYLVSAHVAPSALDASRVLGYPTLATARLASCAIVSSFVEITFAATCLSRPLRAIRLCFETHAQNAVTILFLPSAELHVGPVDVFCRHPVDQKLQCNLTFRVVPDLILEGARSSRNADNAVPARPPNEIQQVGFWEARLNSLMYGWLAALFFVIDPEIISAPIAIVDLYSGDAPIICPAVTHGSKDNGLEGALVRVKEDIVIAPHRRQTWRDCVSHSVDQHFETSRGLGMVDRARVKLKAEQPAPTLSRMQLGWEL